MGPLLLLTALASCFDASLAFGNPHESHLPVGTLPEIHHGHPSGPGASACNASSIPATFVSTTSGIVYGHPAHNASNVTEYLGIQYGKAPVNSLRFAAPQAYRNSSRVYDGLNFAQDCPTSNPGQYITNLSNAEWWASALLYGDRPGEDCLHLNVWAPKKEAPQPLKPVMVWIYGGGFRGGGTNTSLYNGQYFSADEDVVFVTINYRVNIFGFSGAVGAPQNVGLLDQRLAVEWVRDNIVRSSCMKVPSTLTLTSMQAAFGGDPSRITLLGVSAGAISIGYYLYKYRDDPIIAGTCSMEFSRNSTANTHAKLRISNSLNHGIRHSGWFGKRKGLAHR